MGLLFTLLSGGYLPLLDVGKVSSRFSKWAPYLMGDMEGEVCAIDAKSLSAYQQSKENLILLYIW
jgi:hypothetical protein